MIVLDWDGGPAGTLSWPCHSLRVDFVQVGWSPWTSFSSVVAWGCCCLLVGPDAGVGLESCVGCRCAGSGAGAVLVRGVPAVLDTS